MSSDKYYVGSTHNELSERIRRHNSNHKRYMVKASNRAHLDSEIPSNQYILLVRISVLIIQ